MNRNINFISGIIGSSFKISYKKESAGRFYPSADPSLSYFAIFFVAAANSNTMKIP